MMSDPKINETQHRISFAPLPVIQQTQWTIRRCLYPILSFYLFDPARPGQAFRRGRNGFLVG
jgi:hypothetical protein